MHILALVLFIASILAFLYAATNRVVQWAKVEVIAVGLALFAGAFLVIYWPTLTAK